MPYANLPGAPKGGRLVEGILLGTFDKPQHP